MHELSICRSISGIVESAAAGRRVQVVRVRIGALRQIVPDTLVYCWGLTAAAGPCAGSVMEVESVPAAIECDACGARTVLAEPVLRCARCGGASVTIVAGEEFLVTSLELGLGMVEGQG